MLINFDQVFSNDFKCITLIKHLEIILSFSNRKPIFRDYRKILEKYKMLLPLLTGVHLRLKIMGK